MTELVAHAATAVDIGRRGRQEDAVIADFSRGSELGLAVLSDGMGGHNDGDLASRIIAGEMFGELFFSGARAEGLKTSPNETFQHALEVANKSLQRHAKAGSISKDTGGTLISVAVIGEKLRWISVGDSPLYLYRGRKLHRLNEIHSMASQIDMMVRCGELDPDVGRDHPQRLCLASAITGGSIRHVDCPETALRLKAGDIVILASDGINTLSDQRICELTKQHRRKHSDAIAKALMKNLRAERSPDQDNISMVVIKIVPKHKTWLAQGLSAAQAVFGLIGDASDWAGNVVRCVLRPGTKQARS